MIFAQHNKESYAPFPSIITDSAAIGTMAAEHFLDRGFQNFAYCGLDELLWSRGRVRSTFRQRLEQAGFAVNQYNQPASRAGRGSGSEQSHIAEWLQAACPSRWR